MPLDHTDALEKILLAFHREGEELPPLDAYGITPAQVAYIDFIGAHPGSSQLAIAKAFSFKPGSVSLMVGTLVEKGWVERKTNPADARQFDLSLSPQGEALWAEVRQYRHKRLSKMLSRLSPRERDEFIRLFKQAIQTDIEE